MILIAAGLWLLCISPDEGAHGMVIIPKTGSAEQMELMRVKSFLPPGAIVLAPWDFDYFSRENPNTDLYHASREPEYFPVIYFMAQAYASEKPETLYRNLRFISATADFTAKKPLSDIISLRHAWHSAKIPPYPASAVYFVFSTGMIDDFSSTFFLGQWDFTKETGPLSGYKSIACSGDVSGKRLDSLNCNGYEVNLDTGLAARAGQQPAGFIKRCLILRQGQVVGDKMYPANTNGWIMEILLSPTDEIRTTLILDAAHFNSNFNQMFLLGVHDSRLFERVTAPFKEIVLYRLLPRREQSSP